MANSPLRSHVAARLTITVWLMLGLSAISTAQTFNHPAEALIANSKVAMRGDPEESKRDAEAALDLLRNNPDTDLEVMAHLQLCDYYTERDNAKAKQQYELSTAQLPKIHRQALRASVLLCDGAIAETEGEFTRALAQYDQAVSIARRYHDDEILAEGLYQRGYVFGLQGQYANGLDDLRKAQALFDSVHLPKSALTALSSVATLYNRLGDYEQALHIYRQSLDIQRKENMQREVLVTTYSIGSALEHLQRWDEARSNFEAALQQGEQLNYARGQTYALRGLAAIANATGNPQTALEILDRASKIKQEVPDLRLTGQLLLVRGTALLALQRTNDSIAALEEAKKIFATANSVNELSSVYVQLAPAYAQAGNWHKAYETRSEGQQISESVLHNQLDQRFATLKIEFDTANKEKENELLTRENAANQMALEHAATAHQLQTAVIALSAILLLMLGTMVWYQRRGKQHMRNLAMTDELTGMPNRRSVLRQLDGLLHDESTRSCAMLIIDIDHFKSINDRFGHPVGDEVLKSTADQLRKIVQLPSFAGRLGGEEFILVLPDYSHDAAVDCAESLRANVAQLNLSDWLGERQITISIGVTMAVPNDTPSTMLRRADAALYAAKHAGRNCVRSEPPVAVKEIIAETSTIIISVA